MMIKILIHPYAGITRIRLEGIISAANRQHPLICIMQIGCKGTQNIRIVQILAQLLLVNPRKDSHDGANC